MSEPSPIPQSARDSLPDRFFPTLTSDQISRIAAHGRRRSIALGEVLVGVGDKTIPFFVVLSGAIQAWRPSDGAETLNRTIRAGQFTGEASLMTGRRSMAQLRVSEPGEAIELS